MAQKNDRRPNRGEREKGLVTRRRWLVVALLLFSLYNRPLGLIAAQTKKPPSCSVKSNGYVPVILYIVQCYLASYYVRSNLNSSFSLFDSRLIMNQSIGFRTVPLGFGVLMSCLLMGIWISLTHQAQLSYECAFYCGGCYNGVFFGKKKVPVCFGDVLICFAAVSGAIIFLFSPNSFRILGFSCSVDLRWCLDAT